MSPEYENMVFRQAERTHHNASYLFHKYNQSMEWYLKFMKYYIEKFPKQNYNIPKDSDYLYLSR